MWQLLGLPKQELISHTASDGGVRELSVLSLFYKQGWGRTARLRALAPRSGGNHSLCFGALS